MDRHDLYEICVQNPRVLAAFLRGLHGNDPTCLAEDFCGTAAMSREWVRRTSPPRERREPFPDCPSARAESSLPIFVCPSGAARATCLDADASVIEEARKRAVSDPTVDAAGMEFIVSDALLAPLPRLPADGADVVFVGNFSVGEIHDRGRLMEYLRRVLARLRSGGIFVCDTYGGESAWRTGSLRRIHHAPSSERGNDYQPSQTSTRVHYTWEQRAADPFTARVVSALHFRVEEQGEIVQELTDAFVYHWRIWSVPELRDAMHEAGFEATEFHTRLQAPQASCDNDENPDEHESHFAACVVGRTAL